MRLPVLVVAWTIVVLASDPVWAAGSDTDAASGAGLSGAASLAAGPAASTPASGEVRAGTGIGTGTGTGTGVEAIAARFAAVPASLPRWLSDLQVSAADREALAALPVLRVAVPLGGKPPYLQVSASGEVSGQQAQVLVHLAAALGLRLQPTLWQHAAAARQALLQGQADLLLASHWSPELLARMDFSLGVLPLPLALVGRQGAVSGPTPMMRLALAQDDPRQAFWQRHYPLATLQPVVNLKQALQAVAQSQADAALFDLLEGLELLKQSPVAGLEVKDILPAAGGYLHLGLRQGLQPLLRALNAGIAAYRVSPAFAEANAALVAASAPPSLRVPAPLWLPTSSQQALAASSLWRLGTLPTDSPAAPVAARPSAQPSGSTAPGAQQQPASSAPSLALDYAHEVAMRLGVAVQAQPFDDEAQLLKALRAGRIDAVAKLQHSPAHRNEFDFSLPYLQMPYQLAGRRDGPLLWDLSSARGRRVAIAAHHPVVDELASLYPGVQWQVVSSDDAALERLRSAKAEAAVVPKLWLHRLLQADRAGQLQAMGGLTLDAADGASGLALSDTSSGAAGAAQPDRSLVAQWRFATLAGPASEASLVRPVSESSLVPPVSEASLVPLINAALADIPAARQRELLAPWLGAGSHVAPPAPWQRHIPVLALAVMTALGLGLSTWWWVRRMDDAGDERHLAQTRLDSIGRILPGVAYRYVFDEQGLMVDSYLSPGAAQWLGFEPAPDESLGTALAERMLPERRIAFVATQRQAFEDQDRFSFTAMVQLPGRGERWLRNDAECTRDEEGYLTWTGVVVDVTRERQLRQRNSTQEQERRLILASASHALRVPTQRLRLSLQQLRQGLGDAPSPWLDDAQASAEELALSLDEMLDAARADATAMPLKVQDVQLRDLVQEVVQAHQPAAQAKGVALGIEWDPLLPQQAQLDAQRLKQVLHNLLANALNFTEQGSVVLQASRLPAERGGVQGPGRQGPVLLLQVIDTGEGIAASDQALVFEPFAAVTMADGQRRSTGLGLSVCKRWIKRMGGEIDLLSQPGGGTQVSLRLPLLVAAAGPSMALRKEGALLVCDPEPGSRQLLSQLLEGLGHPVLQASDAEQALQLCRQGGVRALLTAWQLPDRSGSALLQEVSQLPPAHGEAARIVGILVAADGEARTQPYDAWLPKPVHRPALIQVLQRLLGEPAAAAMAS